MYHCLLPFTTANTIHINEFCVIKWFRFAFFYIMAHSNFLLIGATTITRTMASDKEIYTRIVWNYYSSSVNDYKIPLFPFRFSHGFRISPIPANITQVKYFNHSETAQHISKISSKLWSPLIYIYTPPLDIFVFQRRSSLIFSPYPGLPRLHPGYHNVQT